jgi:hypothetical protein
MFPFIVHENGVRVFPTKWDDDKNFITPQTTKVTALCNNNVVANENTWDWQPCTDLDVSVKYQLFEQNPIQSINLKAPNKTKEVYDDCGKV